MVRVIAELSANTFVSSGTDRYRFRYGYGSGGSSTNDAGCASAVTYKRPAPVPVPVPEKQVETVPLLVASGGGGGYHDDAAAERGREIINSRLADIEETNTRISMMVEIRRNMHKIQEKQEMQQMREINEKSEKEKQEQEERRKQEQARKQEQEKEKEERRKKLINYGLGEIIYMARNGGLFQAHHSIHMTVKSVYDKKTMQTVQTYTEKVVWNDQVFETKQDWFREMENRSAAEALAKMKIVRCD
jgi:hypothetical protein